MYALTVCTVNHSLNNHYFGSTINAYFLRENVIQRILLHNDYLFLDNVILQSDLFCIFF